MRVAKEKKEKPIPEMPSKDALEFMKKMGVNMEGMEHEVQDIWKMLNDMSTNDPLQYQKFVDDQISNFREAEVMKGKVESEGGGGTRKPGDEGRDESKGYDGKKKRKTKQSEREKKSNNKNRGSLLRTVTD